MLNPGQHRLLINVPVPAPGWNLSGNARHLGEKRGGEEEEGREREGEGRRLVRVGDSMRVAAQMRMHNSLQVCTGYVKRGSLYGARLG